MAEGLMGYLPEDFAAKLAQTWPAQLAKDAWSAFKAPGNAYRSTPDNPVTTEQMIKPAADFAGMIMGGAYPNAQAGAVGIFGGKLARTANQEALSRAEQMVASGANRDKIWHETGWFQGSDGKWRFEIDDSTSRMNPNTYEGGSIPSGGTYQPVAGQLWHQDLYKAYPELRRHEMKVTEGDPRGSFMGATEYSPLGEPAKVLPGQIGVSAKTAPQAKSIGLHELQHAVQQIEGFGQGADFNAVGPKAYWATPGEVEARNVQKRMFMGPWDRHTTPPWITEDELLK